MSFLLKFLPLILVAASLYSVFTADARLRRAMRRESKPLGDWSILEGVRQFERALEVKGLEVRLLDAPAVNAVVVGGNEVYLTQGLYDAYLGGALDRDDVLGVIAHELGHLALGHVERRMDQIRVQTVGMMVAGAVLSRALMGWVGLLAALLLPLLRSRMSRNDEFEADAFGAVLLERAGLDPLALARVLRKTERLAGIGSTDAARQPPVWLRSHPPTADRVAALEARLAER